MKHLAWQHCIAFILLLLCFPDLHVFAGKDCHLIVCMQMLVACISHHYFEVYSLFPAATVAYKIQLLSSSVSILASGFAMDELLVLPHASSLIWYRPFLLPCACLKLILVMVSITLVGIYSLKTACDKPSLTSKQAWKFILKDIPAVKIVKAAPPQGRISCNAPVWRSVLAWMYRCRWLDLQICKIKDWQPLPTCKIGIV